MAGFDEKTDYYLVFRYLLRAWRELKYTEYRQAGDSTLTMNAFLHAFDLTYPMRRLKFVLRQIDRLYLLDQQKLGEEFTDLLKWIDKESGNDGVLPQLGAEWIEQFREALLEIKRNINVNLVLLTQAGRELRSRFIPEKELSEKERLATPSPIYEEVSKLLEGLIESKEIRAVQSEMISGLSAKSVEGKTGMLNRKKRFEPVLTYFLGNASGGGSGVEEDNEKRASSFLENHKELQKLLDTIGDIIEERLKHEIERSDKNCCDMLSTNRPGECADSAVVTARSIIQTYYRKYGDFDMIIFPFTYGTGAGGGGLIDVARVSPEDAKSLIDERVLKLRKLAGTSLGNFGAFMEKRWRQNDIMWGQLDGAERIISALMPDKEAARAFTGEAQAAIVLETIAPMGCEEAYDLLVEPFMRPDNGQPDPESLTRFTTILRKNAGEELSKMLDGAFSDKALRDHYLAKFRTNKGLEPQSALKNAARATSVTGKMLAGIATQKELPGRKYVPLITTAGRFFLWLVEAAIPRSFSSLIVRHWIQLLYLFEVVLFIGGFVFLNDSVQRFSIMAFALTVSIHVTLSWLNSLILFRKSWTNLLKSLAVVLVILLIVSGLAFLYAFLGFQDPWWNHFQQGHEWINSNLWRR